MKILLLLLFYTLVLPSYAADNGVLRVATFLEPPFVDVKQGRLFGENIDIIKLLAKSVNLNAVFLQCPFARCMLMMEQGQADLIMGLRKTPERLSYLTFLTPPYRIQHFPLRFFLRADSDIKINNHDDLASLAIGVLRGATYYDHFDNDAHLQKIPVTNREQLLSLLLKKRIDTFIEREESIMPLMTSSEYQQQLKLADYAYDHAVESYIAIAKNSPIAQLSSQLSQHLAGFAADGTLASILKARPQVTGTKGNN